MTQNEFDLRRKQAVENMRQMNARSTSHNDDTSNKEPIQQPKRNTTPKAIDIPFLDFLSKDKDAALIIGLLLILMSERSDKTLLFALVYILL